MESTILYKFRSGTNFEALPLPGSAARLFDVKKAIVQAKKLDSSSLEFDLAVQNADTNEEYVQETMILPRGTRLIVQRLPATKGHGFLARMARNEPQGNAQYHSHHAAATSATASGHAAPSGYYTVQRDEDEEFVNTTSATSAEQELAALQAVTAMPSGGSSGGPAMVGGYSSGGGRPPPAGQGRPPPPPPRVGAPPPMGRPNADPELREQEKRLQPKKRATGIPRTFLNLNAPPQTEAEGTVDTGPLLQPNTQGFAELVSRGGGQSENITGTRRDFEYALKLTATTVPDHLLCGICQSIVKNAMILPWDPEGRTACETCIRDALTQNGFRCPLTGMDGVSPDDLIPNIGLRKAAELFIKEVMEKIEEIEKQQVEEADTTVTDNKSAEANILDGDGVEKGVIVSKKMTMAKKQDDDPFGAGDDDFGGDVFAVETEKPKEEEPVETEEETKKEDGNNAASSPKKKEELSSDTTKEKTDKDRQLQNGEPKSAAEPLSSDSRNEKSLSIATHQRPSNADKNTERTPEKKPETPSTHSRERYRRRGPPAGYSMGPAGGALTSARRDAGGPRSPHGGGPDRGAFHGRGRGGDHRRDRTGSFDDSRGGDDRGQDDDSHRGNKRSFDEESEHSYDRGGNKAPRYHDRGRGGGDSRSRGHDDRYGDPRDDRRGGGGDFRRDGGGRGGPPPFRGGFRGGRGGGRGGGYQGGRGGRGGYRGGGRGRY